MGCVCSYFCLHLSFDMKKVIFIFSIIVFCQLNCSAQESKEDFLNEVNSSLIDFSYRHFYLAPEAKGIWNNYSYDKKEVARSVFEHFLSKDIISEIYDIAKDTSCEKWNFDQLKKAKCILHKNVKSKVSKHHFLSSHKGSKRKIFSISKPVFSKNKEWAIISMNFNGGMVGEYSYGSINIFHRINGKWEFVFRPCQWINEY